MTETTPPAQPAAYRPQQFCEAYGLSIPHLYRLLERGEIRFVKSGRATLIPVEEARRWLASLPSGAKAG
jgi:excisionase family DNA binding protein